METPQGDFGSSTDMSFDDTANLIFDQQNLRSTNGATGLLELPAELLLEIMGCLPWEGVLRMRKTCKHLSQLSKAPLVWRTMIRNELTSESHPLGVIHLERSIDTYTANELEYLFLRWKSAEIAWTMVGRSPTLHRTLDVTPFHISSMHLVKGGRWLLLGTHIGSVMYYDLDERIPTQRLLIPTNSRPRRVQMAVDVDTSSPTLSFRLALRIRRYATASGFQTGEWIEVWQVGLLHQQHTSTLVATQLCWFNSEPPDPARITSVSILNNLLAYSVISGTNCIVVVDWEELRQKDLKSGFEKWVQPTNANEWGPVQLLPGGRVLFAYHGMIRLFNISSFTKLTVLPYPVPSLPQAPPIWSTDTITIKDFHHLQSSFFAGYARIMVNTENGTCGLILPTPGSDGITQDQPELVHLSDIPPLNYSFDINPLSRSCYGYQRSAGWTGEKLILFHHPWPKEGSNIKRPCTSIEVTLPDLNLAEQRNKTLLLFDIGSGRVILNAVVLNVLDLALTPPRLS